MTVSGVEQLQQLKTRKRNRRTPPPPPLHPKQMGSESKLVQGASATDLKTSSAEAASATSQESGTEEYFPSSEGGLHFVPEQGIHHLNDDEQRTASAEKFLHLFSQGASDAQTRAEAACWLNSCSVEEVTNAILEAAATAWPRQRDAAIDLLGIHGPSADAELRRSVDHPVLSPWIQSITGLSSERLSNESVSRWLAVETVARVRETGGVSKAYTALWRCLGKGTDRAFDQLIEDLLSTRHPQSGQLAAEFRSVHGTRDVRQEPPLYTLDYKVSYIAPAQTGQLTIPGDQSLEEVHVGLLNETGWEQTEQYLFQVGSRQYSEVFSPVHGILATHSIRVDQAFNSGNPEPIIYMHGDWHRVEISLTDIDPRAGLRRSRVESFL